MEKCPLNLPVVIKDRDLAGAVEVLRTYYGARYPVGSSAEQKSYTGAWFDEFDPSRTRSSHPNDFTSDDLVSVALLNTPIGNTAARSLLLNEDLKADIGALLRETSDTDCLWGIEGPLDSSWSLWELENILRSRRVKGVGPTIASKLIARKRPHLYPVNDSVVRDLIRPAAAAKGWSFVGAVHEAFQDEGLRDFLVRVRQEAGLPDAVPLLRIFDVLAWMQKA